MLQIRPPKKIAGQIKGDDVAGTMLENFATADDAPDYKEDVFGVVSFTGDNVIAVKPHGNPWERGKSALQSFVVTKRFKKIYWRVYDAKNAIWRDASYRNQGWPFSLPRTYMQQENTKVFEGIQKSWTLGQLALVCAVRRR
jgi:hypothetical protein